MPIPTDVVAEFDPKIRQRGHEYFISGDVKITEARAGLVRARVHGSQLYNVAGHDVGVLSIAIAILAVSAFAAGLIPARRAASTDPVKALRTE